MKLEQWDEICLSFQEFFTNLGITEITDQYASFTSHNGDVLTHFRIKSDGRLSASMPLHGVDGKIDHVEFDNVLNIVRTWGKEINYEYQVPKEILRRRSD
tara:strand:+ start:47 stop:346 length:300 start_codon:yes stop_codon:yes gene_type:complete